MKLPAFEYRRAASLADAIDLLGFPDAKAIAGGQSLLAALAFRLSAPSRLVDIGAIADLRGVSIAGDHVRIGALTTHAELGRNSIIAEKMPLLQKASRLIAHPAIRNRGTIGGSLAYADPASELPACMVCLGADIIVASASGERRIAASDFFVGLLSTALDDGELIVSVEVPSDSANIRTAIIEIARRSGDYAMAGCAAAIAMDGRNVSRASLALFGVGDTAVRAEAAADALAGKPLDAASVAAACVALADDLDPPADQHGGPEMKRHLACVALERALKSIAEVDA